MELTDAEREEFNRLAAESVDPELWTEDDLPLLRRIRDDYKKRKAQESDALPAGDPDIPVDDDGTCPDSDDA
jgi:hypothetical protein